MKKFLFALLLTTITSCGTKDKKDDDSSSDKIFEQEVVLLDKEGLKIESSQVSGQGSFVFNAPLSADVKSEKNFDLNFTIADGGELTLATFSDNKLANGVDFHFKRAAKVLKVVMKNKNNSIDVSEKFASIDASGTISVSIDMHNGEEPAHILIWKSADAKKTGEELKKAALINTEDLPEDQTNKIGNGTGTFAGISLKNAAISSLKLNDVLFEDEGK